MLKNPLYMKKGLFRFSFWAGVYILCSDLKAVKMYQQYWVPMVVKTVNRTAAVD